MLVRSNNLVLLDEEAVISITREGEINSRDQVRELIEVLNDAVSDGDKIVVVSE